MKPNGLVLAASITSQTSMPMAVVDDLELVDEGDVDGAEDVLGELHRLGRRASRRPARSATTSCVVERARASASASAPSPPTTFGIVAGAEVGVARVLALGREGEEEVRPALQAGAPRGSAAPPRRWCRDRSSIRARRAGPGAGAGDRLRGVDDVGEVRLAVRGERRRHADQDRVGLAEPAKSAVASKRCPRSPSGWRPRRCA